MRAPKNFMVPAFPTVTQLNEWGQAIARALVAASPYEDRAEVAWFKRASQKGATFEDLADVGESRFHQLDAMLCQKLIRTFPVDLKQRLRRKEEEAWNNNSTITVLQAAWMVYDYYKTEEHMSQVYGFSDLSDLMWYGDDNMLAFLSQWDFIISHLEDPGVSDKCLRDMLFRQVESPPLWQRTLPTSGEWDADTKIIHTASCVTQLKEPLTTNTRKELWREEETPSRPDKSR